VPAVLRSLIFCDAGFAMDQVSSTKEKWGERGLACSGLAHHSRNDRLVKASEATKPSIN
jgi:hypothetical protein